MSKAAVRPFFGSRDTACPYWIAVNVLEDRHEVPQVFDDARTKSRAPDMPPITMDLIEPHGEDTQDPLHDAGEIFASRRADKKMYMIPEDTEVFEMEAIAAFREPHDFKEEFANLRRFKDEIMAIGSGNHMIAGALPENPTTAHTQNTPSGIISASFLDCKNDEASTVPPR